MTDYVAGARSLSKHRGHAGSSHPMQGADRVAARIALAGPIESGLKIHERADVGVGHQAHGSGNDVRHVRAHVELAHGSHLRTRLAAHHFIHGDGEVRGCDQCVVP